jgi:hypothetical protein
MDAQSSPFQVLYVCGGVTLLRLVACLLCFLFAPVASLANSNAADYPLMIKVIRSQTLALQPDSTYVQGCNPVDYSAECMHSSNQFVQNRIVVTINDGKRFTIACTIESRWSNCIPLPEGESFRARIEKNGLSVIYQGPRGPRKQHYDIVPDARGGDESVLIK